MTVADLGGVLSTPPSLSWWDYSNLKPSGPGASTLAAAAIRLRSYFDIDPNVISPIHFRHFRGGKGWWEMPRVVVKPYFTGTRPVGISAKIRNGQTNNYAVGGSGKFGPRVVTLNLPNSDPAVDLRISRRRNGEGFRRGGNADRTKHVNRRPVS